MPSLPTDIIGALYTSVRLHEPQSIEGAIDQWMERLGHTKPIDLFGGATDVHAKLKRTSMIVDALSSVLQAKAKGGRVVRHAGSLSSLAIPDLDVPDDSDETYREYRKQLITERDRVERLIETGGTLKCLVSPYTHIAAVRLGLIPSEQILQKVVPRYNRLLWALRRFRDCRNFQIAWVHRLPHANLFVMGDKQAFVGSHRPRESGFASTTVVKAPELVRKEIDEFDAVFNEAAAAILRVEKPSQDSLESRRLKASVAERIEECKREIEEIAAKPSN